jgi:hypothetical protein
LEKQTLFNTWAKEAISLPGSTFSIWAVDHAPQQHHRTFTACIPQTWGASVWKKKADFLMRARQGVSGTQQTLTEPAAECHPPEPKSPEIHQLTVSPSIASLTPDVWQRVASASPAPPLHLAVVCDMTASTLEIACNATALLRVFDFWITEGLARPGSSLSVDMVSPSRDTMRTLFHISVPESSVGARTAFILGARAELAKLKSESFDKNASAIAEAFHAAVSKLRERRGRYFLIVLSDLRQYTSEWDFDETVPRPATFTAWLKRAHLMADLRETPLRACGLHSHRSPGRGLHTAKRAAQLQELWERTFRAMGAPEVNLFSSCDAGFAAP